MSSDDDTVSYSKKPEPKQVTDAKNKRAESFGFHANTESDSGKLDQIDADQLSIVDTSRVFVGGQLQPKPETTAGGFNPYNKDSVPGKKEPQISIQSKNAKMKATKQDKKLGYLDQLWGAGKKS